MERKQGFFLTLKEEVVKGLSPVRSRAKSSTKSAAPMSSLLCRRKKHYAPPPDLFITRSGSLRPAEALSPLKEGPNGIDAEDSKGKGRWGHWMKGPLAWTPSVSSSFACKRYALRLLLGVLRAPHVLSAIDLITIDLAAPPPTCHRRAPSLHLS